MLSLHWGTNYRSEPDELQVGLGPRLLASPDIDLILGHHAHMVQPVVQIGGEFIVYGLGNFLSNQSPETCTECPLPTEDGVIVHLTVTEDEATGQWSVTEVAHTPTWVDRSNFEIVDVLRDTGRDPGLLQDSARRTASALAWVRRSNRAREAERVGGRIRSIRARPWPERPVSKANRSGNTTERVGGRIRSIRARPWPERPVSKANKSGKHEPSGR